MKIKLTASCIVAILLSVVLLPRTVAQDQVIDEIIAEATENSQLEVLAHELLDVIGPRLVGTPQMKNAHDWAVRKYETWGISAKNEQWGVWRGWERGITHVDMMYPRVVTLNGTQKAWSPSTPKKGVTAELVVAPFFKDSLEFINWLPAVKNKFVMISSYLANGRPDDNLEKWASSTESYMKIKAERTNAEEENRQSLKNTGLKKAEFVRAIEDAGASGIIESYWSGFPGANKIFRASTKKIPTIDLSLEDYGMLYRMVKYGDNPKIRIVAESSFPGPVPTFNTIAEIRGTEKPEEYVILSAHFDSWDGATGATDNGTGTITMMEVARILKKVYPNPKRTILVGHWGAEEQGLNGSRAFVEDHPDIVDGVQVVLNQDNGTGRIVEINGQGFLNSYDFLGRWLQQVPGTYKKELKTLFPGMPGSGGSDFASFVAKGAPAFMLSSLSWDYGPFTWHTNVDTYDKIVFDDVTNNVVMIAILAFMASEDPEKASRERRVLPTNNSGDQRTWPEPKSPDRRGYLED